MALRGVARTATPAGVKRRDARLRPRFAGFNVGDGPAAFLILIIGGLIVGLAIALELSFEPPFWVHILLWFPLATAAVIFSLRVAKALLLALEYRHRAREGQVKRDE